MPITGGTLCIARDGRTAAVADPDRDRVWLVDLQSLAVRAEIALEPGDEPGRITEDRGGRFHVALRRGGAIATIDSASAQLWSRRTVCSAPRGIDYDAQKDALHVACVDGKLVTIGVLDRTPSRALYLEPDLRDVIARDERLFVSRLRSAELLELDAHGVVIDRRAPDPFDLDSFDGLSPEARQRRTFDAKVAWRTALGPSGELWMIHQRQAVFPIDLEITPGEAPVVRLPYGGLARGRRASSCPLGILHSSITRFGPRGGARSTVFLDGALPVDLAISPEGTRVAMAFAGGGLTQVAVRGAFESEACTADLHEPGALSAIGHGQAVAVAWIDETRLAAQFREPPALVIYGSPLLTSARSISLGARLPLDRGDEIFHRAAPAGMACASCHPEGGDDGHVWQLGALGGTRRTQPLGGGLGTPLHWSGDLPDVEALVREVFVSRMGGRRLSDGEVSALAGFLGRLPAPAHGDVRDPRAAERGRALFVERGCESCHHGPRLSDERNHDVGTGEPLQTPTLLGLATRPPYFHDGRVSSLRDRFGPGHSAGHGDLGGLGERDVDDLVAFLGTL